MFAEKVLVIIDAIIEHTNNNDIKFQAKKIRDKISKKKFLLLSDSEQKNILYNYIQEVKFGYDTCKIAKIKATDIIFNVIKEKLGREFE